MSQHIMFHGVKFDIPRNFCGGEMSITVFMTKSFRNIVIARESNLSFVN